MARAVSETRLLLLVCVLTSLFGPWHVFYPARAEAAQPPVGLLFSTFLGGSTPCQGCSSARTFAQNAGADPWGNTYVTGGTTVSDLPVLFALQPDPAPQSTMSAFVAKYDPSGQPLWCTYLGGNNESMGVGLAVMPDGGVAVTGLTGSDASGPFPTLNAFQDRNNGESDYFVAVFDANGGLRYATYLGGSGAENDGSPYADDASNGNDLAVDARGLIYVTGTTSSGASGKVKFPVTANALQPDLSGSSDAFLTIIDPDKSGLASLVYSSFLGGDRNEKGHAVAVSPSGYEITLVGYTDSSDFPTTRYAYRPCPPPSGFQSNGYVIRILSGRPGYLCSHYTLVYGTYLGGDTNTARDDAYGVAVDSWGIIAVTGRTQSADFPMPKYGPSIYNTAPYLQPGVSNDEPYLVKIDPYRIGAASLVYGTFLGGGSTTGGGGGFCTGVAVDVWGRTWVGGETSCEGILYTPTWRPVEAPTAFPYTADALITTFQGGGFDAILMQIGPIGARLRYSTFVGGTGSDRTYGLAADPDGNVVLTGVTSSSDFPVKNPAQAWPGGSQAAFVAKFSASPMASR